MNSFEWFLLTCLASALGILPLVFYGVGRKVERAAWHRRYRRRL